MIPFIDSWCNFLCSWGSAHKVLVSVFFLKVLPMTPNGIECKDFNVRHLKTPNVCLFKVHRDNSFCREQRCVQITTSGGVCSSVSIKFKLLNKRAKSQKCLEKHYFDPESHTLLCVTQTINIETCRFRALTQKMVIKLRQVHSWYWFVGSLCYKDYWTGKL